MKIKIVQPPLNTTMMGVIKGVADYLGIEMNTPCLFGRSGHAFLINIHEAVCPSGPYCWNYEPFISLLENIGIKMTGHGFFSNESTVQERNALEQKLREELDNDHPCSVLNLDNQLISGYDEKGFQCIQPWEIDFPPSTLTFGTWEEIKEEIHACFYSFEKTEVLDPTYSIQESLLYALDLIRNPEAHTSEPYFGGLAAYDTWIEAVRKGYGKEHGNWWNGMVWSECRKMASEYMSEISRDYPACCETARKLSGLYSDTSQLLEKIADKELEDAPKIELLQKAKANESQTPPLLEELTESVEV